VATSLTCQFSDRPGHQILGITVLEQCLEASLIAKLKHATPAILYMVTYVFTNVTRFGKIRQNAAFFFFFTFFYQV